MNLTPSDGEDKGSCRKSMETEGEADQGYYLKMALQRIRDSCLGFEIGRRQHRKGMTGDHCSRKPCHTCDAVSLLLLTEQSLSLIYATTQSPVFKFANGFSRDVLCSCVLF